MARRGCRIVHGSNTGQPHLCCCAHILLSRIEIRCALVLTHILLSMGCCWACAVWHSMLHTSHATVLCACRRASYMPSCLASSHAWVPAGMGGVLSHLRGYMFPGLALLRCTAYPGTSSACTASCRFSSICARYGARLCTTGRRRAVHYRQEQGMPTHRDAWMEVSRDEGQELMWYAGELIEVAAACCLLLWRAA